MSGELEVVEFRLLRMNINAPCRIQKLVLDALGVQHVAAVIGGSMGGMMALEWPLCTTSGYVRQVIPITTSAYHGAWGIAWGEAQRECIQADANYQNGWYTPLPDGQPTKGLGAARMVAMLTYRSDQSFKSRFNRKPAAPPKSSALPQEETGLPTPSPSDTGSIDGQVSSSEGGEVAKSAILESESEFREKKKSLQSPFPVRFTAQSYMQYQASKFLKRFDANCYIHLTVKMDTHDVTRDRIATGDGQRPNNKDVKKILSGIPPGALVVSVESDVLFKNEYQLQLAELLPDARFVNLDSDDGHDGFLLEFKALSNLITGHLQGKFPQLYEGEPVASFGKSEAYQSTFGEAEDEF